MKTFLIISLISLFILVDCSQVHGQRSPSQDIKNGIEFVLQRYPFHHVMLDTLKERYYLHEKPEDIEIRAPTIPPIDDPLIIQPPELNATLDLGLISGDISLRNLVIEGLSTLVDELKTSIIIAPPMVEIDFSIDLAKLYAHGQYDADLFLNLTSFGYPVSNVTGGGDLVVNLTGFSLDVGFTAALRIGTLKVDIKDVKFNAGLQGLGLFLENLVLYGEPVDYWDDINVGLRVIFEYAVATYRVDIQTALTVILNDIVKDCTIFQLLTWIGGGPGNCLNLPELPTQPPATTTTTTPAPVTNPPTPPPTNPPPVSTNIPTDAPKPSTEANANRLLSSSGILAILLLVLSQML